MEVYSKAMQSIIYKIGKIAKLIIIKFIIIKDQIFRFLKALK